VLPRSPRSKPSTGLCPEWFYGVPPGLEFDIRKENSLTMFCVGQETSYQVKGKIKQLLFLEHSCWHLEVWINIPLHTGQPHISKNKMIQHWQETALPRFKLCHPS